MTRHIRNAPRGHRGNWSEELGYVLQICSASFGSLCLRSCWIATSAKQSLNPTGLNLLKWIPHPETSQESSSPVFISSFCQSFLSSQCPKKFERFCCQEHWSTFSETGPPRYMLWNKDEPQSPHRQYRLAGGASVYLFTKEVIFYLYRYRDSEDHLSFF